MAESKKGAAKPKTTKDAKFAKEVESVKASRQNKDMRDLIGLVLESPINSSDAQLAEVDGNYSIQSFKNKNTDVRTRILFAISMKAMQGDIKAAEFLMKYGGFEPPKEHNIDIKTPVFINDLTDEDDDEGSA